MPILTHIVSQHAEEAAFLWLLRDRAVNEPHYRLEDLARLDERVEAHLDGLRVAGAEGWVALQGELKWEEPGEVFAAAIIALDTGSESWIERVLEAAAPEPALRRGFASALAWSPARVTEPRVSKLIAAPLAPLRHIGIMAAAVMRMDLTESLARLVSDPDPRVRARALRAAGELGRVDLAQAIEARTGDDDDDARFWAWWSLAVLGVSDSVEGLLAFATAPSRHAERGADLAARRMPREAALAWHEELASSPGLTRVANRVAGAIGDVSLIPWLFDQMEVLPFTRTAGEAFSTITGADLAYLDLDRPTPEGFAPGPNDDPADSNVAMDADENLPYPDPERVAAWWKRESDGFRPGARHLLGRKISPETLRIALREGRQRQRAAAALESALLRPGNPLEEVRAPARRQRLRFAG